MTDFSVSVAVGQACTQAPQETHSEARKSSAMPGDTLESKPRAWMVSAKVPCTSSQARTQREQTMHFDASKVKYGLVSSLPSLRRSEEHTSELQSLMRISYAVFCLKKKTHTKYRNT